LESQVRSKAGLLILLFLLSSCGGDGERIIVGSKNFTESVLLGEIVAQQLESHGLQVDRRLNLGGSFICHNAIVAGQLDVYVEYTGTAYSAILEMPDERDPAIVRAAVDSVYEAKWELVWTEPLGFNNTFALLIRNEDAVRLGISRLSEAARHSASWRFGAGYEFIERADGYRGLLEFYKLSFRGEPLEMDLGLTYRALAEGTVDIIAGNSTDGQIEALGLYHLEDDRGYFPPYEAASVVRSDLLERVPSVRAALAELANAITEQEMRRLNHQVDVERRDVRDVAREFLAGLALNVAR
jgi:glycine betaine/choline ABC-type transport system substrate-binding protein